MSVLRAASSAGNWGGTPVLCYCCSVSPATMHVPADCLSCHCWWHALRPIASCRPAAALAAPRLWWCATSTRRVAPKRRLESRPLLSEAPGRGAVAVYGQKMRRGGGGGGGLHLLKHPLHCLGCSSQAQMLSLLGLCSGKPGGCTSQPAAISALAILLSLQQLCLATHKAVSLASHPVLCCHSRCCACRYHPASQGR